ncbi:hypothetical protein [uncultured Roseovarius sp.]|uniref:glycine-rich domain-containing protein n=1 Tax=uncultured Roseovarius sp. TaxID=293344 RepID=UPI00261970D5|nr:hypothetical protein [uncultured Roseovarius sp.]
MTKCDKTEMIERAMAFPLDKVIYRYRQETGLSKSEAQRHERELKRFLALSAAAERGYGMRGPIDKLWHTFILFTHIYENFCNKLGGGFIHHYPNVRGYDGPGAKPLAMGTRDYKRFLDDYRTTFGEAAAEPYWPAIPDPKTERFFAVDCSSDDCGNDCDGGTGGTGGDD